MTQLGCPNRPTCLTDCEAFGGMYPATCQSQVIAYDKCATASFMAAKCQCGTADGYIHCDVIGCAAEYSAIQSCASGG